jgi:hypothetical protein
MRTRLAAWKLAIGYLFRTWDFGTFFAFLFLWKRRDQLPIVEAQKPSGFIYPH